MPSTQGRCTLRPAPRPPKKTVPAMLFATCVTCGRHSNAIRTFAHSALACGSMVLYRYCVSFFRPAGRKNDTHEHRPETPATRRKTYQE